MITSYTVVSNHNLSELVKRVKEYLDRGWQPQGGIETAIQDGGIQFFQAMVCYKTD